ncbi:MAG: hypothetical protein FRX48_04390 [Lasallia pustulata]|uniref:Zn(2)-C6 fungal-type domain-containing protein n=1 Tax=Lasallia pustulata TaxID=136370 RepID=A0A5M8PTD2_9LECA|nr:MAG: hypothetical protein FRX48_04390 [Lasallia pustulata]
MPHTGKPSGACQNCKRRHVKCDEARPACAKCVKANVVCPGYVEGLDLLLRSQNEAAKSQVERRQRALIKKRSQGPPHSQSPESSSLVSLSSSLPEPVENRELCFFLSSFVLYPRDPQTDRGFVELLPLLIGNVRPNSPLSLSLAAVSRCHFHAWELGMRDVETPQVRVAYGKALLATRLALQDPVECSTDETLMAVCLLGFYENTADSFRARLSPGHHFEGAATLIKQRKGDSTTSELFKRLLIGVRSNIVYRAVETSSFVDVDSELWQDASEPLPHNPATLLDCMYVDVANLLATADQSSSKVFNSTQRETDIADQASQILLRAQYVDAKLATWPDMLPSNWNPISVFTDAIPWDVVDAGLYGDCCDVYPDITICSTWNDWRHTRLKVLALIATLGNNDSNVRAAHSIQQLTDDICASVPFVLGSRLRTSAMYAADANYPCIEGQTVSRAHQQKAAALGGWALFFPLKEILQVGTYLRKDQLAWVLGQLLRLATVYNIRPVLERVARSSASR